MRLLVIYGYVCIVLQLFIMFVIFATILQLVLDYFRFHPRRTTHVPLVANVTNLVYKSVFCVF
jgi:hypothetical protein